MWCMLHVGAGKKLWDDGAGVMCETRVGVNGFIESAYDCDITEEKRIRRTLFILPPSREAPSLLSQ